MSDYDPLAVAFYDIAHEGAYLRALASAIEEGVQLAAENNPRPTLATFVGMRPRSVVIVTDHSVARECALLAVSFFNPLPCPVVVVDHIPGYIGALDVVIILSNGGLDTPDSARHVNQLLARGIDVVLAVDAHSPLLADVAPGAIIIPTVPTHEGLSLMRLTGTVMALFELADSEALIVAQKFKDLADGIDAELQACSPQRDRTENPAVALADLSGSIIHTTPSTEQPGDYELVQLIATLWTSYGRVSAALGAADMQLAAGYRARNRERPVKDIFYDPFLDDPVTAPTLTTIMWNATDEVGAGVVTERVTERGLAAQLQLSVRAYAATVYF
ncbi:hypothetical protein N7326_02725 [Corynebacterium sp. ES2794-CONJ1]|uniref:hypothetical protein n=1 Tax=unclassified Corynebacterium TaxID=2624378 RepID=UPI002168D9E4|nr:MULTISPECIES: hypothetical protein [unclassified Corynebacterium]MCS4489489.1 hypothetical protein [Corynebacterium sp. ES2775-CONJ]MCS4491500.1 hypothetical protein [Corynebacterium sp. ES2715-CONJ3]MCS4531400.1 hypothetical protein [Corynebacterium sp. ES2730-CONJ]MCU9518787.1 hypothetical protein [Corynebacterium sp. ES2794-CONJ1]